ncbi:MAG: YkgJ family cysteine cluster protein [Nannocystaceae bacterium]|nr:YkgJ family cysteine cluster protein [bacterium]
MGEETARQAAGEALVTLRTRVDAHFDAAASKAGEAMRCARGCDACCHVDLSVFEVEAARVREALSALPSSLREAVRAQAEQTEHCAMLVEGSCAVYDQRPLICRSHGVAVLLEDGSVDHCPLNFEHTPPPPGTVLDLAAINEPLCVMATLWDGRGARVRLATLAASTDATP